MASQGVCNPLHPLGGQKDLTRSMREELLLTILPQVLLALLRVYSTCLSVRPNGYTKPYGWGILKRYYPAVLPPCFSQLLLWLEPCGMVLQPPPSNCLARLAINGIVVISSRKFNAGYKPVLPVAIAMLKLGKKFLKNSPSMTMWATAQLKAVYSGLAP